jgi:copper(I)-binding protein
MPKIFASLALITVLFASPAWAQPYKVGSIEIDQSWTRATPSTARTAGGFLTITNKGTTPDRLIAARSGVSDKVEIHEMKMDGTIMRMRELEKGLEIPPGATVVLKPGSYHIMFMELKSPLTKGGKVPVTLVFEKAGSVDVVLQVHELGASQPGQMKH